MGKQAMGLPYSNFQTRFDHMNVLQYPQKPLVSTNLADSYGVHDLPAGQNAVVAIMSFSGFGQEDSIIINQSALDRGFGRADKYRTSVESLSTNGDVARFAKPTKKRKTGQYDKLDDDGIVRRFSRVTTKDCLIGKQIEKPMSVTGNLTTTKDTSILSDTNGVVEDVIMYQQRNGERAVKVQTRCLKTSEIGDKFSSR